MQRGKATITTRKCLFAQAITSAGYHLDSERKPGMGDENDNSREATNV